MSQQLPPVIALIITYQRTRLAVETIRSVKQFVQYPNIGFHIADDGSDQQHIDRLLAEIGPTYAVTMTNAQRGGVGKSMNLGMQACLERADFILWLEDDWVLRQPLDLAPCVELLLTTPNVGMVRLGRLSAGLTGHTIAGANKVWWLLQKNGQTYVYSGNAHLRHRRFCQAYGPFQERLGPGQTELAMCGQFNATKAGPDVVWPAWLSPDQVFQHIGDHQSFKVLMESEGLTAEAAAARFGGMP